jgi:hypothetical protein
MEALAMSDDSETAQDQGLVNRVREYNEMQKVGPTYDAPGSGGRNALAALQGRIRNLVAAFGGASRLARQLADEFGDPIGESGVRAWTAQGNIPLRRRHQLARLGRSNDLLVDVVTLEVHFGPAGGDVGDSTHLGTAAFLSLDEVAARWRLPRDRVENLVHSGQLLVHVLAGTERVAYTDLADYEHRARRSGPTGGSQG